MYIKQIIIQGFKSYKEQTVIEPFSPKSNVVVGRNGSGKSNFFAAVRFVLGDEYSHLGREERQALLHEGSGSAVMSAYVEVIFDNSDDRFPTGKPELILRRTIGVKKDEYSLDRKNATKSDVMNLLESAGFSRANPYYIVPQGRVTKLTNMDEAARLNLLKDVAGTQVYEARRSESLKIIADTDNKRAKIDDLLDYIKERLTQLEEEKNELRKYQEKDREHRSLQYTILVRSQQNYQGHLERIDEQRTAGVDETDENQRILDERQEEIERLDEEISQAQRQIESLKVDKAQLNDERTDLVRQKAKAELEVKTLAEGQSAAKQSRQQRDAELKTIRQRIQTRESELKKLVPRYEEAKAQEDDVRTKVQTARSLIDQLRSKQGRSAQYRNKKERDDALKSMIDSLNAQLAVLKANALNNDEDVSTLEEEITQLETEVADLRSRIDNRGTDAEAVVSAIQAAKETHDQLQDSRRELWREQSKLEPEILRTEREWQSAEGALQKMADRNTWQAIKAVRKLKERHNLQGVYGTLGELFQVNKPYQTAVEITAGQSLFHWVVDTDQTASQLIDMLNKEKAGRISCMPLNRLRPRGVNIPKASDAVPMISKIQFDSKYENAFQHVFGKTIICPNLQVASQYARSHGVSAITPEGDRADKKGALTGGYHDTKNSRLDALRREQRWREEYEEQLGKGKELRRSIERLEQEISRALGDVLKAEQNARRQNDSFSKLSDEIKNRNSELLSKRDLLDRKRQARNNLETDVGKISTQQSYYQAEMSSPFQKALTSAEEQQLESTASDLQSLRPQLEQLSNKRSELEARKSAIELELNENLRPTLDQFNAQGFDNDQQEGGNGSDRQVQEKQRSLDTINKKLDTLLQSITNTNDDIDTATGELNQLQESRSNMQKQREELERRLERHQRDVVRNMEDRRRYAERLADVNKEIRDLGVLPEEAFEKYKKLDLQKAMGRLQKVKDELKKFSGVNKKAFEQYNNFTKQKETLTNRRSELEGSRASIQELIDHLDQRKDEAIQRTFKQVSREFANVFERLVPAGVGRLVIVRKSDQQAAGEDGDETGEERGNSIENYKGVGIRVSFNSKHDEQQKIQQLSGGQKSLCALALVFAIQQCDPAPFYLFDEIDANLDAQYRTAVAAMLKQLSEAGAEQGGGQFICTTFRPEMVRVAEKCYGVGYSNKTSSIDVVDREQALEFVEGATQGKR